MSFLPLFPGEEIKPPKKKAGKADERGCKFCPLNEIEGIRKIKGTIHGRDIAIFAQSPGPEENKEKLELVGPSGEWLWKELRRVGIERDDCDIQNVQRCFPADLVENSYRSYLKMRNPHPDELRCCSIYTDEAITKLKAKQILVFGQIAAKALLHTRTLPSNKIFWDDTLGARVYLLDHPSFFIRGYGSPERLKTFRQTLDMVAAARADSRGDLSDQYAFIRQQDYRLVLTGAQAIEAATIIRRITAKRKCRTSVDIEDADFNGTRHVNVCGFSPQLGLAFVFILRHKDQEAADSKAVRVVVRELLEDQSVKKAFQYGCSDCIKLEEWEGIKVRGFDHDTNISEYLRFPDLRPPKYGLDTTVERRFPEFSGYWTIVVAETVAFLEAQDHPKKPSTRLKTSGNAILYSYLSDNRLLDFSQLSLETLRLYNGADCDVTKRIEISNKTHVHPALMHLYIDLSFILYKMEPNGPLFDYQQNAKLEIIYKERVSRLETEIRRMLKISDFNPGSPQQVHKIIYETLGLEYPLKKGKPNTGKKTLLMLSRKHPFPKKEVEWRGAAKAMSTYILGYKECADLNNGYLHTTWWACMPAGELVLTNRGYLPVEQVRKGDLVITHKGRAKRVLATIDNGIKPIIQVTLENGMHLRTTFNHRYRIYDRWIQAKDLKPGMPACVYGDREEWKDVKDHPGYTVSSWGRVHSAKNNQTLSPFPKGRWGHLQVGFYCKKGSKHYPVHRLVAQAFKHKRYGKPEVRHLNGYSWDNVACNLCWGTSLENALDTSKHGTNSKNRVITANVIEGIRSVEYAYGSDSKLARELGISRESVKDIRTGRYHKVLPTGKQIVFKHSDIKSVERLLPEMTYGLQIEDDASHVTGGIVTHNTGTRTGRLRSGGGKKRKDSGIINLQNVHNDPHIKNQIVSDARWKQLYIWIAENNPTAEELEDWIRETISDLETFLVLDYGQVEVRVFAQMSGDKNLIADCMSSDIHTKVGVTMTGWAADMIKNDKKTRTLTKNVHFAILFGTIKANLYDFVVAMSDPEDTISQEDVEDAFDRYFERYDRVKPFQEEQVAFAEEHGYVETLFFMRQPIHVRERNDEIDEDPEQDQGREGVSWRNQAINGPVQGSAHQLLECGLVNIRRQPEKYKVLGIPVLDVHDNLTYRVKVLDLLEAAKKAKYLMEQESLATAKADFGVTFDVPIITEVECGLSLGCQIGLDEGMSVGAFLLKWFEKRRKQLMELNTLVRKASQS